MASSSVGYGPDAIFRSKLNCDKALGKWCRVSCRGARFFRRPIPLVSAPTDTFFYAWYPTHDAIDVTICATYTYFAKWRRVVTRHCPTLLDPERSVCRSGHYRPCD